MTLLALCDQAQQCRRTLDLVATGAIIEKPDKASNQFTLPPIQALMFYMCNILLNIDHSLIPNKNEWLIMLRLGVMALHDRSGMLTDEARDLRQYTIETVSKMRFACVTIPTELQQVIEGMQKMRKTKLDQARAIVEVQWAGAYDGNAALDIMNNGLGPAQRHQSIDEARRSGMESRGECA